MQIDCELILLLPPFFYPSSTRLYTSARHTARPGCPCYKQLPVNAMADELLLCLQDFSYESSSAAVRAYASFSDGFMNDVTDLPGLNITSLAPLYLSVNDSVGNITVSRLLSLLISVDIL